MFLWIRDADYIMIHSRAIQSILSIMHSLDQDMLQTFSSDINSFSLFSERSGAGAESLAMDCFHWGKKANHRLWEVHPGRHHPRQAHDQHCVQLCTSWASLHQLGHCKFFVQFSAVYFVWIFYQSPVLDRVKSVIHKMRRYGVTELFEPQDLMELRNIPLVTKSLAQLCRLVRRIV